VTALIDAPAAADTRAAPRRVRRRGGLTPGKLTLTLAAYTIAMIFILPYVEMVITALRPPKDLLARGYLPKHFDWSNFTSIWKTGFGGNLSASLKIAGGATLLVLVVALPAAYYTA
jgi:multiple sugar transport system permease protein